MRAWRVSHGRICCRRGLASRPSVLDETPRIMRIASLLHGSGRPESAEPTEIYVPGFIQSLRRQKKVVFAAIRDGSSLQTLQAVLTPTQAEELSNGTAVMLRGTWEKCSPGQQQTHELRVLDHIVLGENDAATDPIQKKYQSAQFLRTIPHLRPRLPFNALLLRLRSHVIAAVTCFFAKEGFVQTHTPVITSSDCEGAGEVFTVSSNASKASEQQPKADAAPTVEHFFKTPKYLTVSAQLHLEALAQSVGQVWTLSPTFRAEKSDTPRHLSEFYMLEAELCFVTDIHVVMNLVENMLRAIATDLEASVIGQELLQAAKSRTTGDEKEEAIVTGDVLQNRWQGLMSRDWARITYATAIEALSKAAADGSAKFEYDPSFEEGLQAEHERYIATHFGGGSPVFVMNYPRSQKPFYMSPSATEQDTVDCFDLLVPDLCELVGGSMREHRSDELIASMKIHGLLKDEDDSNMQWYIDLRRYGSVPHGGFGLGFDRLLSYLSGASNIRDIVAFPRWHGRCDA